MTVADEDVEGHFNENPFAEDALSEQSKPEPQEVEESKVKEEVKEEVVIEQATNLSFGDASQASDDVDLDEWQQIDVGYFESLGLRPPDLISDPFKEKWSNIKTQYKKISKFKDRKTYTLRPVIIKANDDCRQEVLAI